MQLRVVAFTTGLVAAFCLGMLICLEVGRRLGIRDAVKHGPAARAGVGIVDGSVYGLLAMLLGFSYSGAAMRFDARRDLVAREVNAISGAWLNIHLLPAERQPPIRRSLLGYLDALLSADQEPSPTATSISQLPEEVARAEQELWRLAVSASLAPGSEAARGVLPSAISEVFEITSTGRMARRIHPPRTIFVMLGIAAAVTALFAGYGLASAPMRHWLHVFGLVVAVSATVFVIIELEYPRLGLIRIDEMDQALLELRARLVASCGDPRSTGCGG